MHSESNFTQSGNHCRFQDSIDGTSFRSCDSIRSLARFQCWGLENGSRVKTLVLPVLGAHLNLQYPHTYWAGVISGASCPARLPMGSSGLNERPSLKI